jgi:hypothetical protein
MRAKFVTTSPTRMTRKHRLKRARKQMTMSPKR